MVDTLSRMARELAAHTERLRGAVTSVDAELAGAPVTARSAEGTVEAAVDHRGRLVDLRIPRTALTRGHGGILGEQIAQAVNVARDRALHECRALIRARMIGGRR
ncbi:hypothetical protein BLA60_40305 [Actinophytocola xinjiangensis]|uniref:YbaB/EbfC DNA-binding family protein n=1 Tax=Actinophytocola xinjiangensis TaxID=485602 RepID=A0A7Z1ATL8_9PSEU|nr:YbaB/EbfC family nucleoid-associated protein [Actinophytocola xinjiangensis]OLF04536.1 hypothetical protein BLA60_40305 [Actinophytocola xinjiangensis]